MIGEYINVTIKNFICRKDTRNMKDYELWKETFDEDDLENTDNTLYALRYIIEEVYCQDNYCDCGTFIDDVEYLYRRLTDEELKQLKEHNRKLLEGYFNDEYTVNAFRGYTESSVPYDLAVSFTPRLDYAEYFADLRSEDYREEGHVASGIVNFDDIIWVYQQNNNDKLTEMIIKSGSFNGE